jgi:hypothetical protein
MSPETPSTNSSSSANVPASSTPKAAGDHPEGDSRVFVEIPKAGPGQGYRAPKNIDHPTLNRLSKLLTWLVCAALVAAPAFVIGLICFLPGSHALQLGFAWLWIVMFILTESIGVFSAIGIYREAVGTAGNQRL